MKKTGFHITTTKEFSNSTDINAIYNSDKNISIYLKTGWLSFEVNGKPYKVEPESIFIINRGSVYKLKAYSEILQLRQVVTDPGFASKLLLNISKYKVYRALQLRNSSLALNTETFQLVWQQIEAITYYLKRDINNDFQERILGNLYMGLIYMVMIALFDQSEKKNIVQDRKETITVDFLELVEQNFKQNRSLGYYATNLNLSSKYISSCVSEITGMSPSEFIAKTTSTFARSQLLFTSLTVAEIADQLNFSDAYSFGKFFKKHSGYSPGKFRKLMG